MRLTLIAVIAVAGTLASPASADWQNTTWEMTRAQVIRATGAGAIEGTEGQRVFNADLGAAGPYSALGFSFTAQYFFDRTDRLRVVKLVMTDESRCGELKDSLAGIYGAALESSPSSTFWIDAQKGNGVRYTAPHRFSPGCFVAYTPISPTGDQGL